MKDDRVHLAHIMECLDLEEVWTTVEDDLPTFRAGCAS